MTKRIPRDTQTTCADCGWRSKVTTAGLAARSLRLHSCEKYRSDQAASARYIARDKAVDRTPKPCNHKRANHQHGTHACYVLDRCRCIPCAVANTDYERDRAKRHAYGQFDTFTDAQPVRVHVLGLMMQGVGLKTISRTSGVSTGTLGKLIYGHPRPDDTRRFTRRVLRETAEKLLAVTEDALAPSRNIPVPIGASRRVQALIACGWSVQLLAARSGVDRQRLDAVVKGGRDTTVRTVTDVTAMFEELWDVPPPEVTHHERIAAARSRRRAAAAGWPVPLAWDDIDTDRAPSLGMTEGGIDLEEVAWLERQGYSLDIVAARLGVTRNAIDTARRRAAA